MQLLAVCARKFSCSPMFRRNEFDSTYTPQRTHSNMIFAMPGWGCIRFAHPWNGIDGFQGNAQFRTFCQQKGNRISVRRTGNRPAKGISRTPGMRGNLNARVPILGLQMQKGLAEAKPLIFLVARGGIEPPTQGFSRQRSTAATATYSILSMIYRAPRSCSIRPRKFKERIVSAFEVGSYLIGRPLQQSKP